MTATSSEVDEIPGNIIVIDNNPIYQTLALYVTVWIFFFLIPLYVVYASLKQDSFSVVEFAMAALLGGLMIIRYGAIGSLTETLVIFLLLAAAQANDQIRLLVDIVLAGLILSATLVFARDAFFLKRLADGNIDLSDNNIAEMNLTAQRLRSDTRKIKRLSLFPLALLLASFSSFTYAHPEYGGLAWLLPSAILLHYLAHYFFSGFDRGFVIADERGRRLAYFRVRYIDRQFVEFVSGRGAGLIVLLTLYGFVITFFAFSYYLIDHCSQSEYVCQHLVDRTPFNKAGPSGNNFSNMDGSLDHESQAHDAAISARRFLPYLYFSVVTTTTVGYGDIAPLSVTAVWIVIVHHLLAIALLIGVAGQIGGLVARQRR